MNDRDQAREAAWQRFSGVQRLVRDRCSLDVGFDAGVDWQQEQDQAELLLEQERTRMTQAFLDEAQKIIDRQKDQVAALEHALEATEHEAEQ